MRYIAFALTVALFVPVVSEAGGRRARTGVQDLIFFGEKGPVLLRLQVEIDGKSAENLLRDYFQKWVAFMDRDLDGVLNSKEIQHFPNGQMMQQLFRTGYYYNVQKNNLTMAALGMEENAKVGADDLLGYYRRSGISPFQVAPSRGQNTSQNKISEILFKRLDVNNDKRLSGKELANSMRSLLRLDLNDDELVSQNELMGTSTNVYSAGGVIITRPTRVTGRSAVPSAFYLVPASRSTAQLTALLLAKYDGNKDTKLSLSESRLNARTFSRLDINKDKSLSIPEMIVFLRSVPPLPVVVRLGATMKGQAPVEAAVTPKQIAQAGAELAKTSSDDLHLMVGDAKVSVHRIGENPAMMRTMTTNRYAYLFRLANPKNKNFIKLSDLQNNVRFKYFVSLFPVADKNGDGKLTMAELDALSRLTNEARRCFISLRITEEGRALYKLMDSNGDGQLSRREVVSAWKHLDKLDRNNDGHLTVNEFARQYVISVNRGQATYNNLRQPIYRPGGAVVRRPGRGPVWFQRMDINNDGDVSAREFLGSAEDFRRIDADHDGMIDSSEAQAAK